MVWAAVSLEYCRQLKSELVLGGSSVCVCANCVHICMHVHTGVGAKRQSSCLVLRKGGVQMFLGSRHLKLGTDVTVLQAQVDGPICGLILCVSLITCKRFPFFWR